MTNASGTKTRDSSLSQGKLAGITLLLLVILFLAINQLASVTLRTLRLDLTQDRLYTLSDATEAILGDLKEPIRLRFYYSTDLGRQIPGFSVYANRVQDLLQEYVNASGGSIVLDIYDPKPFTEVEDQAVSFGLQGVPVTDAGPNVFFGLVGTNSTDDVEVIPFFQPAREGFLEYDISQLVHKLASPRQPVLGVITRLPMYGTMQMNAMGQQEQLPPWIVSQQMSEVFETEFLGAEAHEIPDSVSVLVVAHPRKLDERTLFAIDQYLLKGGKAILLVDPYSEQEFASGGAPLGGADASSSLDATFAAWGLEMDRTKVVADRLTARKVQVDGTRRLQDYVVWLELRGPNILRDTPIVSGIDNVTVASAGALRSAEGAPIALQPILQSSPGSMLVDVEKVWGFRNPQRLLQEYQPTDERYVIAARVTGEVETGFPDGPPEVEGVKDPETVLTRSEQPLDVIVIADTDILADRFWVIVQDFFGRPSPVPTAGNGDFLVNALEAISGSNALVGLRGRGSVERPFDEIRRLEREADQRFQAKERQLRETLQKTEQQLTDVRRRNPGGNEALISDRDRRTIERYQRRILELRSELRDVQRALREDIETLERQLWFYNIAIVPIIVTLLAIAVAVVRTWRRRRHLAEATG